MRFIVRRPEAEVLDACVMNELKILLPVFVVAALFHFVNPLRTAVRKGDRRAAVFDSGCEEKLSHRRSSENIQTSAINHESRTGYKTRFVGGQETDSRRDVFRLANRSLDLLGATLHVWVVPKHRRVDGAGRDAVDANLPVRKLLTETSRERFH